MRNTEMGLLLVAAMALAFPKDVATSRMQPIKPVPPIGKLPPTQVPIMKEFSVTIGTANSSRGYAWILTVSQRPDLQGHWFAPGTRVEIFASPAPGFIFSHWTFTNLSTGNVTSDRREIMTFIVRGHTAIVAHFSPAPRPPVRPVPPIGTLPPTPRPPVRPVPPIGTLPPTPRPPVRPVPPIGTLPTLSQDDDL